MKAAIVKAMLVVLLPVTVFLGTGWPMLHLTERDQFRRTAAPHTVPLNFRMAGYDAPDAVAYWDWLGPEGRAAERRFLKADLAFPVGYGAALLASVVIAWRGLGRPFKWWLAAPPTVAVLADWCENALHLAQLRAFELGGASAVAADAIAGASAATTIKSAAFHLAALLVLVLAGGLIVRARARSRPT